LKRKREEAELARDPKLKEFLQVYQAPSKTNMWTNGDIQTDSPVAVPDDAPQIVDMPADESDDDYQVIAKKPKTTVDVARAADANAANVPTEGQHSQIETADKEGVEEATEADRGPVSDIDWLRSRTNRVLDLVEDDDQPATPVLSPETHTTSAKQPSPEVVAETDEVEVSEAPPEEVPPSAEVDKIRDTGRLYLRNLHFEVTEDELRQHFAKYGSLEEVSCRIFYNYTRVMMNNQIGTTDAQQMRLPGRVF
jgi:multiple RNA-binding domain-containing protein 1